MYQEQTSRDGVGIYPPGFAASADAQHFGDILPSLPILTTTRLQLELLLNDPVIDLKAVTDVILADAGATLQILRIVGSEFGEADDKPDRIEDCIVTLSTARCHQVICASSGPEPESYIAEWQYCRRRAECARDLAKTLDGVSPEEAYMVGLLHRLGSFPHLLGWSLHVASSDEYEAMGVMLAFHWNLPSYLVAAIKEKQEAVDSPKWGEILRLADQLMEEASF
jgi:HD-like signal output (HDOD) protein